MTTITHTATNPIQALARLEAIARRVIETARLDKAEQREMNEIIHIAQELANDMDVEAEAMR